MRNFILVITLLQSIQIYGQSDHDEIRKPIESFIYGTIHNSADSILKAFYPGAQMFLHTGTDQIRKLTVEEYASFYTGKESGATNDRPSKIISIEQVLDVAYAKVEVMIPYYGKRFNDLLLLKKFDNGWKIVAKCTSAEPIPKRPEEMVAQPQKETIIDGLNRPWSMAFISEMDVLISEKDGNLLRADLNSGERKVIKGLPKDVARAITIDTTKVDKGVFPPQLHGQTRSLNAGWFQVLLDPDFEENSFVYLSYAAENKRKESTTKVIRGMLKENELTKVETLFEAPYSHGLFHYGGGMIFGADKKLYITIGERNYEEYLNPDLPFSQDISDKRGKVIRINPDGSIPEDNPNFGSTAIKGLYALGIRASQGFTTHPETGDIWFSEHGTTQGDELNVLRAGVNYGWPYKTSGKYRSKNYNPVIPEGLNFEDPIYFWNKTIAPTGLAFYNGREFPQWKGDLLVPGLSKGSLWRMTIKNDRVESAEELFINDRVRLRKVAVSPRGQLYLLTDEENGQLIKLINKRDN